MKGAASGNSRLERLRRALRGRGRLPALVAGRAGVRYLSGFTGSSGWLLITGGRFRLITDFRYREQAREEVAPGVEVVSGHSEPAAAAAALLRRCRRKKLAVDEAGLSLKEYRRLAAVLKGVRLFPAGDMTGPLRKFKDDGEERLIREACRRCGRVWSRLRPLLRRAMTELEVSALLRRLIIEEGGRASFEPIVAVGPHASQPHARPSHRKLRPGQPLMVDFGLEWKGYHSDLTRTLALGRPSSRFRSVYRAVFEAQVAVLESVRPGVKAASLDRRARETLARYGLAERFGHSLGHGLGLEVHEEPRINRRSREIIREGMVFSVEPGVYIPGWGGVRVEDVVIVGARGAKLLTRADRDIDSAWLEI